MECYSHQPIIAPRNDHRPIRIISDGRDRITVSLQGPHLFPEADVPEDDAFVPSARHEDVSFGVERDAQDVGRVAF